MPHTSTLTNVNKSISGFSKIIFTFAINTAFGKHLKIFIEKSLCTIDDEIVIIGRGCETMQKVIVISCRYLNPLRSLVFISFLIYFCLRKYAKFSILKSFVVMHQLEISLFPAISFSGWCAKCRHMLQLITNT